MVLDPQELTINFVDNMKYENGDLYFKSNDSWIKTSISSPKISVSACSLKGVKFIDEKALECYDRLIKEWVVNEIDKAIKGQKIDKVIKEQNKFQVILGGFD